MHTRQILAAAGLLALAGLHAQPAAPWQQEYRDAEASGDHVIALWQFDTGKEAEDASGHGHGLALRGRSVWSPEGRFGGCLESFRVDPKVEDKPVGATTRDRDTLSPEGAFTLELWLKPKAELAEQSTAFLIDKKFFHYAKDEPRANTDYALYLQRHRDGGLVLTATLGFGKDSVWASSKPVTLEAGRWVHLAYSYDGAGTSRFYVDGAYAGRVVHEGRGAITPGTNPLIIGDRVGSSYGGCAGWIDQVRLCRGVLPWAGGQVDINLRSGRTVFERLEKDAAVEVVISNDTVRPLPSCRVRVELAGRSQEEAVPELAAGAAHRLRVPVDTGLKPGQYPLRVALLGLPGEGAPGHEAGVDIRILARRPPGRFPVVMWGSGDLERLEYVGFTHHIVHLVDYRRIWDAGKPTLALDPGAIESRAEVLDEQLAHGIDACVYVFPGRWAAENGGNPEYLRVDRAGKPAGRENASASHPDLQRFGYDVGASVAQTFGKFPALNLALVHSEIRDGTALSFHDFEVKAAREALGSDIPREAISKSGVHYSTLPTFPADRVVADDDPLLRFYTWFWKDGDGWNPLHTQVDAGLKSTGRSDFRTFFDPAVRVPSVWGSGGGVDVISQWTYSYPDPIKIGQATDELFAMADGRPGQEVMKMTQVIWYRSGTAPELPADEKDRAAWEKEIPDAKFITIAPDHMREAFWSKLSRPVRGIMYHGWGSLYPATHAGYRHTNPQTREVLKELVAQVVRPLGPTLLQVPDRPTDVALLESFSSQIFAGRGSHGWSNSWEARLHLILQWASLQPRVIYDEHIRRDGLDQYKVLVMPNCDVLTASVVEAIKAFQRRGGLVIADEFLCPAISPDIVVPTCGDQGEAHERKAVLQAAAAQLRQELDPFYRRYADSDNPEVVPRVRRYVTTDYLFAVNDYRTYGDYVGHHRKVMEKGLPSRAELTLHRRGGTVYDLVAHREVPSTRRGDAMVIPLDFGPGDGRLLMVTDDPIRGVVCRAPGRASRGQAVPVSVRVRAGLMSTPRAVVPVEVTVLDAAGAPAEGSGYYAAVDGRLGLTLDLASNDAVGTWRVRVRELASGQQAEAQFQVD